MTSAGDFSYPEWVPFAYTFEKGFKFPDVIGKKIVSFKNQTKCQVRVHKTYPIQTKEEKNKKNVTSVFVLLMFVLYFMLMSLLSSVAYTHAYAYTYTSENQP